MARFQILCLSGGGYLRLYTARILEALEQRAGVPLGKRFDLICGTSIGGILALGLAFEVPVMKMIEQFEINGQNIFPRARRGLHKRIFRPAYSDEPLRAVIQALLGNGRCLGDAKHPTLIPAVSLTKGSARVFKTPHHPRFELDWSTDPVDIALATSAAPTLFPAAKIGDNLYADGGIFATSPDLMGLHEARVFFEGITEDDIHVLSIGTTSQTFSIGHSSGRHLGLWGWGKRHRMIRIAMSSQQKLVDDMISHILKDRYLRIDANPSLEQAEEIGIDWADQNAIRTLGAMASNSIQTVVSDPRLNEFIGHIPPPIRFFHGPQKHIS